MNSTPQLPTWNVAMLGPTRVGKTSLLTALQYAANDYFDGTPIDVRPEDEFTRQAFAANNALMLGELMAGRFSPDSLPGGREEQPYGLRITSGVGTHVLSLRFNDYPGGWIKTARQSRVEEIMGESPSVMVPIDATLLMEADTTRSQALVSGLGLIEVESLVATWATKRHTQGDPTRLILVPVKCESYFSDNGGRIDDSDRLFRRVKQFYGRIVDRYIENASDGQVLYAPVDTIGPIELMDVSWERGRDNEQRMRPEYRVRKDGSGTPLPRMIKGAEPILAHLIRDVLETQERALQVLEQQAQATADRFETEGRGARSNWFKRIVDSLSGRNAERTEAIENARKEMESIDASIKRLAASAASVAAKDAGRVRRWA